MNENKITLVLDYMDTLFDLAGNSDKSLIARGKEVEAENNDIFICSSQMWMVIELKLERNNWHLSDDSYLWDEGKSTPEFWKKIIAMKELNKEMTLVIDDSKLNCEAARKAGLTAIQWELGKDYSMNKLNAELAKRGCKPA